MDKTAIKINEQIKDFKFGFIIVDFCYPKIRNDDTRTKAANFFNFFSNIE